MSQVTSPIILDSTGQSIVTGLTGLANAIASRPAPAEDTPLMDGVGAVGSSLKYARENHVHPTDTSRASADILDYETNTVTADESIGVNIGFTVESAAPFKDLKVTITPVQSGSGDPSTSNIRPITGWTGVSVYHSGGDTSNPDTITVDWAAEAGTVYGGTLDVLTGLLTVTHISVDMGSFTWRTTNPATGIFWLTTGGTGNIRVENPASDNVPADIMMDRYKTVAANDRTNYTTGICWVKVPSGGYFGIKNSSFANWTVDQVKTAMAGVQLVYKLATPQTYQLTPHQMETFAGVNNIWSTANGISVTYRLGTNALLQDVSETAASLRSEFGVALIPKANQAQIATVETGDTASQAYAIGDYFCRGGLLYRVTAAISSGQTFTVNTNCVETTIMAEIIRLTT